MAKIFPTIENIKRLKVKPTEGELYLIEYLLSNLSDDIEIYFQPFLNGDRPDIILLQKGIGATIIEVKDWNLNSYFVDENNKWHLKSNDVIIKSPLEQVNTYKDNMFNLHINGLLEEKLKNPKFYGRINTYIYFHNSVKDEIDNILSILINSIKSKINTLNERFKENPSDHDNYNKQLDLYNKELKDINFEKDIYLTKELLHKIKLPKNDSLELFKDSIYEEFKRHLQPPIHILNQGKEIIYTKSQLKFINSGEIHQKIKGVAGSGKTTVLAKRAVNAYLRHNEEVLILTFNITVKNYIHDRISDVRENFSWNNFHILNYHNFFNAMMNEVGIKIDKLSTEEENLYEENSQDKGNDILDKAYYSNINLFENYIDKLPKYKTILIDEVQDYKSEWIKIIRKYFTTENSEIVLFGDEKQNIYERKLGDDRTSTIVQGFGEWGTLKQSLRYIRNGGRISSLSKKFQYAFFDGKYDADESINNLIEPQLKLGIYANESYQFDSKYSSKKELEDEMERITEIIFKEIKNNNIHPNEITILSSHLSFLIEIDFLIRKKYNEKTITTFESKERHEIEITKQKNSLKNIRKNKKIGFNANSGLIKLSTIHSYKGFDSNTVFLIVHPEDNDEIVYTGLTRSKYNLMVFTPTDSKFNQFFNIELGQYEKTDQFTENINTLKDCVKNTNLVNILYEHNQRETFYEELKPYKILFMNDNYYLACESSGKYKFIMLRISNIKNISFLEKTFSYNMELLDFVENIQTPFAKYEEDYKEKLIKVLIEVDKSKVLFFENKKFLPSQKIIDRLENGNLLLSFLVTQELEIEELIKKWLPYLKVIEPLSLDEKIKSDIKKYLI